MQACVYNSMNNAHTNDESNVKEAKKTFFFFSGTEIQNYLFIFSCPISLLVLQMYEFSQLIFCCRFYVDFPLLFRFGHPKQWKPHKKLVRKCHGVDRKQKTIRICIENI